MNIHHIRAYVVVVNGGSGCIFQPFDPTSTYILTAKHVIEDAGNVVTELSRFELDGQIWNRIPIQFHLQENVNYFAHTDRDVAILKIPKIQGIEQVVRTDAISEDRKNYILSGYPQTRRDPITDPEYGNGFRQDEEVTIHGLKNNFLVEAKIPDNPGFDEIQGHSGGALGKIRDDFFMIAGIQSQMVDADGEQLGRIDFSPMSSFDDLVSRYPNELSTLVPAHLGCFSFLKDSAFIMEVNVFDEESVAYTRNYLKNKAENIIASAATPLFIKDYFKTRLLLNPNNPEVLDGRSIWIAWLEFLTILNIIRYNAFDETELAEIFDSFRLLFSDTKEDWTRELQSMIYSDYKGLKKGGVVVISTIKSPLGNLYEINAGKIPKLMRANVDKKKMKTDDGINFPFDHYRFVHLDSFKKKCIMDKLAEYENILDEQELLLKLQEEYGQYIS